MLEAIIIISLLAILFTLFRLQRDPYGRRVTRSYNALSVGVVWRDEVIVMKLKRINWIFWGLISYLLLSSGSAFAQTSGDSQLQIRLRNSDGTAVVGETVILQWLPEEEPIFPDCTTDAKGECTWYVRRGLYQVLFERPLDDISALAVAEGGLRGLGITVGDEDITYHFTFHSDSRVYFDAAPEAAVPSPIIPIGDTLHGGTAPTAAPPMVNDEPVAETPTPEPTNTPDTAVDTVSGSSWRLILFISGGLVIGGGLHLWSRKKQAADQMAKRLKDQATTRPGDEETNHA